MFPRTALVILGLLLAAITAILVAAVRQVDRGKHMRVINDTHVFRSQLQFYHTMNGSFPTMEQGLRALVQKPTTAPHPTNWCQLLGEIPRDPLNTDYIYRYPGTKDPDSYDLFSAGPDRKPDTADDDWGE